MSGVRVAVEWMFGRITSLFQVLGFPRDLRVLSQPVGAIFLFCGLFTNFRTMLDGRNEVSDKFNVKPPASLTLYIHNA